MEVKKSQKVNLESYRGLFTLVGLFISLILVWFVLGYSVKEVKTETLQGDNSVSIDEEFVQITKRTLDLPPPPPKKVTFNKIEIVDDDQKLKDIFINNETNIDEALDPEPINEEEPIEEEVDNTIYTLKDLSQMPEFPGGEAALLRYIATHVEYPQEAQENGIEGKVYVRFVVTKDGTIGKVEALKDDIDPLLNEAAIRVIKSLPRFKPGVCCGHKVNVWYVVPIDFRLE